MRAKKDGSRLAKAQKGPRAERTRADSARTKPRGNPHGKVGNEREIPPLGELLVALQKEGVRFQIARMSAAILQGVPGSTLDFDIWIGLPERQYLRVLQICRGLGATVLAPTAVALRNDSLVNFLYRVDGLASFNTEYRRSAQVNFHGTRIRALTLEQILKSKRFLQRPKDVAHLPLLEEGVRCAQAARARK